MTSTRDYNKVQLFIHNLNNCARLLLMDWRLVSVSNRLSHWFNHYRYMGRVVLTIVEVIKLILAINSLILISSFGCYTKKNYTNTV